MRRLAKPARAANPESLDHRAGPECGVGLLELVVATALFLAAAVVIGPLFSVAERAALEGRLRTRALRFAVEHLELWTAGEEIDGAETEYFWLEAGEWRPESPPAGSRWVRETQVDVVPLEALEDGRLDLDEALDEAAPGTISLVRVEVRVRSGASGRTVATLSKLDWTGGRE